MKKLIVFSSIFLFMALLGCKGEKETKEEIKEVPLENSVTFRIDERTEFLRTVFNIAVQYEISEDTQPCKTPYLERVNSHFLKFKDHPLMQWIYNDESVGMDFSTVGLMFKDLETFAFDTTYTKELKPLGLTKKKLDSVRPFMVDFYQKSKFHEFFKSNEAYYKEAISNIEQQVSEEQLIDKVLNFYQSDAEGLELIVFVELTNNANNKAVSFYDNYNPKKRAVILTNLCDMPDEATPANAVLSLDEDIISILYHETSHLFTQPLLEKYVGDLAQYKTLCEDCSDLVILDDVDHKVVRPLQGILAARYNNDFRGRDFFTNSCTDVRKEIYKRLMAYQPDGDVTFEEVYLDCINLIKKEVSKK